MSTLAVEGGSADTPRAVHRSSVIAVVAVAVLAALAVWTASQANGRFIGAKIGLESITQLHAVSAHFPIALLLTSVFFELIGLLTRRSDLQAAAFWSHLAGTAGAAATVVIGFVGNPFAHDTSEIAAKVLVHQRVGVATVIVFGLLAVWRVARGNRLSRIEGVFYALATLVGVAAVSATGYLGGHLMD